MTADDNYARYYAEKLWELVPSQHRQEDGLAERPGTMRAFIELVAEQAALLRRSHDRLWDDAFIDLCDDWAVPYIGDLVATRMVSALNKRGRRVDVAKTIYYRRRKGTPRVLEELIADITGWEGKVVESFRFLGRFMHRLDLPVAERVDPSPGWADLRSPRLTEMADGPWDPFAHTADVRKSHGKTGRWNIPKISFHLFRLASIPLEGVTPHVRSDGATFTFDPSGRDTQLFVPRLRDETYSWDDWQSALPWQVPAPMGCRLLGHAEYEIRRELVAELLAAGVPAPAVTELGGATGARFTSEAALRDWLRGLASSAALLAPAIYDMIRRGAIVAECGKAALWPDGVRVALDGTTVVARARMAAASIADWSVSGADSDLLVDPQRGRFALDTAPAQPDGVRVAYSYGFGGRIGAGGYDRRAELAPSPDVLVPTGGAVDAATFPVSGGTVVATVQVSDSATYAVAGDPSQIEKLVIQAANFQRPYVRLAASWVFTAAPNVDAELVLDGLWLGASAVADIVLRGAWASVVVRHSTLDPGGTDVDGAALPPVRIRIEGSVERLEVSRSIASAISTAGTGEVEEIVVKDSILDAQHAGGIAIVQSPGNLQMRRTTVLGGIEADRLDASDVLVTELVEITDTQNGCFRFSSAPEASRLPHPYRWVKWDGGPVFGSTRFGDASYSWLAESAPDAIRRGGEDGGEIGAWSSALNAIKEDSLLRKVEEYLPFGLVPVFIRET
ncbi:MAG: hypothetical protein HOV81_00930 [Kofleriaceae bacterium]|nr:hypothetical protein [Kofleriaceae bacterium]